jgi:hypothetical protein
VAATAWRRWQRSNGSDGSKAAVAVAVAAAMWQLQLAALVVAGSFGGSLMAAGRQRQRGGAAVAATA